MAERRKLVDERDARRCLAALARSNESLRDWALRHGVDGRSLRAWKNNLERANRGPVGPAAKRVRSTSKLRLVELVPSRSTAAGSRYVIRIGAWSVEIGDDFDTASLQRIAEVLRSC